MGFSDFSKIKSVDFDCVTEFRKSLIRFSSGHRSYYTGSIEHRNMIQFHGLEKRRELSQLELIPFSSNMYINYEPDNG